MEMLDIDGLTVFDFIVLILVGVAAIGIGVDVVAASIVVWCCC